jgi:hypothetical protein
VQLSSGLTLFCAAIYLASHAAFAQTSPETVLDSAVNVATSWPADLAEIPIFVGEDDSSSGLQLEDIRNLGLPLDGRWYDTASVLELPEMPNQKTLNCLRVGRDMLGYLRNGVPEGAMPNVLRHVFSNDVERETLASLIPKDAEAAMVCTHSYRIDETDAAAVNAAWGAYLASLFTNVQTIAELPPLAFGLAAKGWLGEPSNGIAQLEIAVDGSPITVRGSLIPGKMQVYVRTYSWLLPFDS